MSNGLGGDTFSRNVTARLTNLWLALDPIILMEQKEIQLAKYLFYHSK